MISKQVMHFIHFHKNKIYIYFIIIKQINLIKYHKIIYSILLHSILININPLLIITTIFSLFSIFFFNFFSYKLAQYHLLLILVEQYLKMITKYFIGSSYSLLKYLYRFFPMLNFSLLKISLINSTRIIFK
jgi:hypothetical protein